MSSPLLADMQMLEPIVTDGTSALTIDDQLRRCSGYFAAAWRYETEIAKATFITEFRSGAVWRAEAITLQLTDPAIHDEVRAQIQTYSEAYFVQFQTMPPRIDPNTVDPLTTLYLKDSDACHDIMFEAAEAIKGLQ